MIGYRIFCWNMPPNIQAPEYFSSISSMNRRYGYPTLWNLQVFSSLSISLVNDTALNDTKKWCSIFSNSQLTILPHIIPHIFFSLHNSALTFLPHKECVSNHSAVLSEIFILIMISVCSLIFSVHLNSSISI